MQRDSKEGIFKIKDRKDGSRGGHGGMEYVWVSNHREGLNPCLVVLLEVLDQVISTLGIFDI